MHELMKPTPLKKKYLTPGVAILLVFAAAALFVLFKRLLFGIGAVTNLDNQYPWGMWIGIDVAAGVALAAGGFTTAALGHIMYKEKYHLITRPALLTALLGYTFVALSVSIDIGRWYYIYHPLYMWNGNSALFEVGICVMFYLTVLYIEFLPMVTERFIGRVNLPGIFSKLNSIVDKTLKVLDKALDKTMFVFIIAGVVLSCLHQSSLGTLMVLAGPKMHPLWQTPVLPLLFLLSAIAVGFPMVIMESLLVSRSFNLKPEMHVLSDLSRYVAPLLGIYLAFKIGDMFIRETFIYLNEFNAQSLMFVIEIVVGVIIPLRLFLSPVVRQSAIGIFIASILVIAGIFINRFNNFIVAYNPPYAETAYFPSIQEILLTLGFIAMEVLLYRALVRIFPVISIPGESPKLRSKYAVLGKSK